jgi:hypothetical protein
VDQSIDATPAINCGRSERPAIMVARDITSHRNSVAAACNDMGDHIVCRILAAGVVHQHIISAGSETFGRRGPDARSTAGDDRNAFINHSDASQLSFSHYSAALRVRESHP